MLDSRSFTESYCSLDRLYNGYIKTIKITNHQIADYPELGRDEKRPLQSIKKRAVVDVDHTATLGQKSAFDIHSCTFLGLHCSNLNSNSVLDLSNYLLPGKLMDG